MGDNKQGEGVVRPKATEEDDVEGHRHILPREGVVRPKAIEPEGHIARKATEDDDVEGHAFQVRSPSSSGE
ncbi:MAG TPA: hypothetical protein VF323_10805 [Candidatus Limnocylindrales bacterium]